MSQLGPLVDIVTALAAAVVIVPVSIRIGASPVLGYLATGLAVGPHGFGLVEEGPALHLFAEFGVVFLLFSIGLELSFERIRTMRRLALGLGAAQVVVTAAVIAVIGTALGLAPMTAGILGCALALSSTAVVLQLMVERGEQVTRIGRVAIAVLLFQDLAVVPMLAALPLLGAPGEDALVALGLAVAKAAVALVGISLAGRYLSQPAFRRIAALRNPDVFMGATLLVVLGTALLTALAGMSLALGAFLAGALLAGTAFRHQIEGDIEPVRGLFLGVFFLSVGMGIDLALVLRELPLVLGLTGGLILVKAMVLGGLARGQRAIDGNPLGSTIMGGLRADNDIGVLFHNGGGEVDVHVGNVLFDVVRDHTHAHDVDEGERAGVEAIEDAVSEVFENLATRAARIDHRRDT